MTVFVKAPGSALRLLSRGTPILVLLAGWELATRSGLISTQVLPTFSSVFVAAVDLIASGTLGRHLAVSLYRALGGLTLSILIGIALGLGMATSRRIENFFDPLVALIYPLPKTALVPLTMVWLGVTDRAAMLVILLACLLPIVINTYHGVRAVERTLIWSARSLGTPTRGPFVRIVIPAAMPAILNGISIAIPLAFIVVISVELKPAAPG